FVKRNRRSGIRALIGIAIDVDAHLFVFAWLFLHFDVFLLETGGPDLVCIRPPRGPHPLGYWSARVSGEIFAKNFPKPLHPTSLRINEALGPMTQDHLDYLRSHRDELALKLVRHCCIIASQKYGWNE